MNVERMLQLADVVERSETYCQVSAYNKCGTPGCIAGHGFELCGERRPLETKWDTLRRWLGITEQQSHRLFTAEPDWALEPEYATREEAAAEIRRMVREYQEAANA